MSKFVHFKINSQTCPCLESPYWDSQLFPTLWEPCDDLYLSLAVNQLCWYKLVKMCECPCILFNISTYMYKAAARSGGYPGLCKLSTNKYVGINVHMIYTSEDNKVLCKKHVSLYNDCDISMFLLTIGRLLDDNRKGRTTAQ